MTNKEIADRLHLSVVTIKLHRGQGMHKMQAETFADLVKMWAPLAPAYSFPNGRRNYEKSACRRRTIAFSETPSSG